MTSLHFVFNTKYKHPEELTAIKQQRDPRFLPNEFDVEANAKERRDLRALIAELTQNNQHDAIVDCLPIALTADARHTMLLDIYDLKRSTSQIQATIATRYSIVADGKTPTIKSNDEHAEFQIEITA